MPNDTVKLIAAGDGASGQSTLLALTPSDGAAVTGAWKNPASVIGWPFNVTGCSAGSQPAVKS